MVGCSLRSGNPALAERRDRPAAQLPDPASYDSADELTDALATRLRVLPLAGQKERVTREVQEWAAAENVEPSAPDVLDKYNAAAETTSSELPGELASLAEIRQGSQALIALLNRAGTSDQVRLLVLDALQPVAAEIDAAEFARVNVKQRHRVLERAIAVLGATESSDALFALEKVYGVGQGEMPARAREEASRLWQTVPAAAALKTLLAGETDGKPDEDPNDRLRAVLALPTDQQAQLLARADHQTELEEITPPAAELDAWLRELAERSSGLGPYEMRLRDELFEFALLSGEPDSGDIQKRARENLFRRDELREVEELAPHLPAPVLNEYARRALTRDNRKGRPARATVALSVVRERGADARAAIQEPALEALDDPNADMRFEAARLLAADEETLSAEVRARLAKVYEGLPADLQIQLAAELRAILEAGRTIHLESFLRGVLAGPEQDLRSGLEALLQRWASEPEAGPDEAMQFIRTLGEGLARLEPSDAEHLTQELIQVSARWLRAQGTRIADPVRSLMSWMPYRGIVAEQYAAFAELLRAEQARALLLEAIRNEDGIHPELLARAADAELRPEDERRLLLPVLTDLVAGDPAGASDAIDSASESGARLLVAAGLLADRDAKRQIAALEQAIAAGATEALIRQRHTVLDALDEAESAAAGNARLLELFEDVRRALGGDEVAEGDEPGPETDTATAGTAGSADQPSDAVRTWRRQTAGRFPAIVRADEEGRQPLHFRIDSPGSGDDLVAVLGELDKRVHSTRVAPVADRAHYRLDLEALVDGVVASGLITASADTGTMQPNAGLGDSGDDLVGCLTLGRSDLREMFFERWGNEDQDTDDSIRVSLEHAAGSPAEPASISMLEAAVRDTDDDSIVAASGRLGRDDAVAAWQAIEQLLRLDLDQLDETRNRERGKEAASGQQVGEELDLPFRVIEQLMYSYFRLRSQLAEAGWRRVEEHSLGDVINRSAVNPERHAVRDDDGSDRLVVRSLGIRFGTRIVSKAILEPLREKTRGDESSASMEKSSR